MKIGIDARMYKITGIGRYIEKLLQHIEHLNPPHDFVVYLSKEGWEKYSPQNARFTKVMADIPWYSLREQREFPKILNEDNLDLMHFPHMNVPLAYKKKFVVTIHDLILMKHPQSATTAASSKGYIMHAIKYQAYKYILKNAAKKAEHILTVSNSSKKDIHEILKVPSDKITTTYLAPDTKKTCGSKRSNEEKYILYVGSAYPHKNIEVLLSAYKKQKEATQKLPHLYIIGPEDYFYKQLKNEIIKKGLQSDITHLGHVNDEDLHAWYCNAYAFVFPSLEEGFGLPPLEAMQRGIPVLSSNASCMPEILGQAAMYFNPRDPNDLIDTFHKLETRPDQWKTYAQKGKEQAQQYSWQECAQKTLRVYSNI